MSEIFVVWDGVKLTPVPLPHVWGFLNPKFVNEIAHKVSDCRMSGFKKKKHKMRKAK